MKKYFIFILLSMFFYPVLYAQDQAENEEGEEEETVEYLKPKTSVIERTIVKEKKPIEYAPVTEENILWSQTVWRRIDCRSRMNFHLYYPTEEVDNRQSLAQAMIEGVRKKRILAYSDEEFKTQVTYETILDKLGAKDKETRQEKMDGTGDTVMLQKGYVNWEEVREFMIKEEWFIDKRHGRLDVRINAICPIRVYKRVANNSASEEEDDEASKTRTQICWLYFPEVRKVLAKTICYTGKNQNANLSFDDIFHKRYFDAYIERVSNEINNRGIREYTRNGLEAILESEKEKRTLLEMESDLWSY